MGLKVVTYSIYVPFSFFFFHLISADASKFFSILFLVGTKENVNINVNVTARKEKENQFCVDFHHSSSPKKLIKNNYKGNFNKEK